MWKLACIICLTTFLGTGCSLSQAQKKDSRFKPWSEVAGTESSAATYDTIEQVGKITDKSLGEISGITASRISPDVFWVHNDSGDKARIYAIDLKGKLLAKFDVPNAENKDWEDIATGPGPDGKPALYIADIGDNDRMHETSTIYRVREPQISGDKKSVTDPAEAFPFSYPDGKHDCEAIFVDPSNEQIYLITKTLREDCAVYRYPLPLRANQKVVVEKVGGQKIKSITQLRMVTGAGISPDGSRLVIRTYFGAFELQRSKGKVLATIFDNEPTALKIPLMGQAEAIAYAADGKSIVMTSEKLPAPIYQLTRK
ncbi:MAG: hypothetical protein JST84_18775 [Acidobacteria bacterium]|nr:hypothetical protein [Acidobacteriota bacterium]